MFKCAYPQEILIHFFPRNYALFELRSDKKAIKMEKGNFICTSFGICDDFYDIESNCTFFLLTF